MIEKRRLKNYAKRKSDIRLKLMTIVLCLTLMFIGLSAVRLQCMNMMNINEEKVLDAFMDNNGFLNMTIIGAKFKMDVKPLKEKGIYVKDKIVDIYKKELGIEK